MRTTVDKISNAAFVASAAQLRWRGHESSLQIQLRVPFLLKADKDFKAELACVSLKSRFKSQPLQSRELD